MRCFLKRLHHGIGDLLASVVDALERGGRDLQARGGRRITPIAEHRLHAPHRLTGPIEADRAAHARRNRVPLRAAGRIMTPRHAQAQAVAEPAVAWRFPQPGPIPSTVSSVAQDQEWRGLEVCHAPGLLPPLRHRRHRQRWRVPRGFPLHRAVVAPRVVDPIRDRTCERITREVMDIDRDSLLTPHLTSVLEVAHQRFLLSGLHLLVTCVCRRGQTNDCNSSWIVTPRAS